MDNTEQNQTEYTREEQALIDVFYKDTYRLNSLISQINNGALQSVKTTMDSVQALFHPQKVVLELKGCSVWTQMIILPIVQNGV